MPNVGDELHHFGWNACSIGLCPWAPHPHVERRYLIVPGLRSSRIHVVDVKDDPRQPEDRQGRSRRTSSPSKTGYSPAAHGPLRARRALRLRARRTRTATARRRLPPRPRHLRRSRAVGDRPRPAVARLRLLVAPRLRHDAHQRVGHAERWSRTAAAGAAARRQVRPPPARLGPAPAPATTGDRPRRRAPDGPRAAPAPRSDEAYGFVRRRRSGQPRRRHVPLATARPTSGHAPREGDRDPGRARRAEDQLPPALKPFRAPSHRSSPTSR